MNALRAALGMSNTGDGYTPPDTRDAGDILADSVACGFQSLDSMFTQLGAYHTTVEDIESTAGLQWLYDDGVTDGVQFIGKAIKAVWKAIVDTIKWIGKQMKRFWKWVFGDAKTEGNGKKGSKYEKGGPKKMTPGYARILVKVDGWKTLAAAAANDDSSLNELFTAVHGYSKLALPDTEHAAAKEKLKNNLGYFTSDGSFTTTVPPDHKPLKAFHRAMLAEAFDVAGAGGFTFANNPPSHRVIKINPRGYEHINTVVNTADDDTDTLQALVREFVLSIVGYFESVGGAVNDRTDAGMHIQYEGGGSKYHIVTINGGVGVVIGWTPPSGGGAIETMPTTVPPMLNNRLIGDDVEKEYEKEITHYRDKLAECQALGDKTIKVVEGWENNKEAAAEIAKRTAESLKADTDAMVKHIKSMSTALTAQAMLLAVASLTN